MPANTLELLRVAERHRVPGVGRQRAMALVKRGLHTLQDVLQAGSDQLLDILKSSLVCSPPRSFLPLQLIAAGQPRLLRPS